MCLDDARPRDRTAGQKDGQDVFEVRAGILRSIARRRRGCAPSAASARPTPGSPARLSVLRSCLLLGAAALTLAPAQASAESEPERRDGFSLGVAGGLMLGSAAGTPDEAARLSTGAAFGNGRLALEPGEGIRVEWNGRSLAYRPRWQAGSPPEEIASRDARDLFQIEEGSPVAREHGTQMACDARIRRDQRDD